MKKTTMTKVDQQSQTELNNIQFNLIYDPNQVLKDKHNIQESGMISEATQTQVKMDQFNVYVKKQQLEFEKIDKMIASLKIKGIDGLKKEIRKTTKTLPQSKVVTPKNLTPRINKSKPSTKNESTVQIQSGFIKPMNKQIQRSGTITDANKLGFGSKKIQPISKASFMGQR